MHHASDTVSFGYKLQKFIASLYMLVIYAITQCDGVNCLISAYSFPPKLSRYSIVYLIDYYMYPQETVLALTQKVTQKQKAVFGIIGCDLFPESRPKMDGKFICIFYVIVYCMGTLLADL